MLDEAGNIYGTTGTGGAKNYGTVYKLHPRGKGKWTERILYSFHSEVGQLPEAGVLLDKEGNIYGTASLGGKFGYGTLYELAPNSRDGYDEKVLWSFNYDDGANPGTNLILDSVGNLYGTTELGGPEGTAGVVFEVAP